MSSMTQLFSPPTGPASTAPHPPAAALAAPGTTPHPQAASATPGTAPSTQVATPAVEAPRLTPTPVPTPVPVPVPVPVPDTLARCRSLVRPVLVDTIRRLDPWTGKKAAYALGWCDTSGTPDGAASQGKGLRQALAVLAAEAVGADPLVARPAAVAVELVHVFSLLHDDIMDGDPTRRGRAAMWSAYGIGPAILTGDALHALAVQCLARTPGPRTAQAVRRLSDTLLALVHGQADDLRFARLPWSGPTAVRLDDYRTMAEHKTGTLLGCAAALGAELGDAPDATVAAFDQAGRHLGVAFQVVDDLLGIWGDPHTTGKPVHGDLKERKKTYPVLAALATGGPAARELLALLQAPGPLDAPSASRAAALVAEAGGQAAGRAEARDHLARATGLLDQAGLRPGPVRELRTLIGSLLDRTH
ncbi:polyprenyl synthetase family protein [Streptomyces odontomachi]|uniref:polyprenyl synthetase family protein n=1 Tax=Streptomyces odontomachi TaxID=2944940 RepID=UPI00210BB713|nr:polyprenyl synthetase family protein [Streptomyces sp. ODS25]